MEGMHKKRVMVISDFIRGGAVVFVATDVKSYFGHMKEGFSYVKKRKIVMNMCLLAVLANAMCVPINSLQSAMTVEIFGVGSELLSVFGIVFTIGIFVFRVQFDDVDEVGVPEMNEA